jgi:dihydroorotase
MFAPPPNSIIDDNGRILPEVLAARRRGVWFDWQQAARATSDGTSSSGSCRQASGRTRSLPTDPEARRFDFPNVMSKFLDFGMLLDQVIARATLNASCVFEVFDRGTLNVGAPADLACSSFTDVRVRRQLRGQTNRRQKLFPAGLFSAAVPARP